MKLYYFCSEDSSMKGFHTAVDGRRLNVTKEYNVYQVYIFNGTPQEEWLGRTDDILSGFNKDLLKYKPDFDLVPKEAVRAGRMQPDGQVTYYLVPV